ncbi:hypothetical protein [Streptomyces sp. ME18-1-4]|uniref:hypothetical protein n=1 Tax=Streptomyces sp. ME18-1-4 TaxID=3028685 RepID=UPI0039F6853A
MALTCGPIPSVRLTKIFRQAQQSTAVTNTHGINQGLPLLTDDLRDFFLFVEGDTDNAAGLNVDLVVRRIPRKFRLDPRRDVQVPPPPCAMVRPAALPSSPPSASWPRNPRDQI